MKKDTAEISDEARRACDQTLVEDGDDVTMRDSEEPLVRIGQGDYEQRLDDGNEGWLDVGIALLIVALIAAAFYLA
jgi:hypothetical protein